MDIYPCEYGGVVIESDSQLAEMLGLSKHQISIKRRNGMTVPEIVADNRISVRRARLRKELGLPVWWNGEEIKTAKRLAEVTGNYIGLFWHHLGKYSALDYLNGTAKIKRRAKKSDIDKEGDKVSQESMICLLGKWYYPSIRAIAKSIGLGGKEQGVYRMLNALKDSEGENLDFAVAWVFWKSVWETQDGWVTPDLKINNVLYRDIKSRSYIFKCIKNGSEE